MVGMTVHRSILLNGFLATFQPDANFGRILAAYGGIFVAVIMRTPRPAAAL